MSHADWLWIPVTVWAAFAQTVRNAAQRSLSAELGTLGATLVRFLYGLPFALLWLLVVGSVAEEPLPGTNAAFIAWVLVGSISQIAATALLLRTMQERNFALGVAYSKSEVLQVALFGFVFLGDPVSAPLAFAAASGTLGVLLLSPQGLSLGWATRPALLGMASGAGFALASVGYRGAALALPGTGFLLAAAFTLLAAQALQTALLGGFLLIKNPEAVIKAAKQWRRSLLAGFMGAAASAGWFTAFAIEPAAHVRTLGLVELVFSYAVSLKLFRERLSRRELAAMALLALGVAAITLMR
ncbi:MAG: EamA/RhaT family transporter [Betaproteobacteria bacterium]|nr:EamA/RhaT family transporter [Betaproteobacteria bacterium]